MDSMDGMGVRPQMDCVDRGPWTNGMEGDHGTDSVDRCMAQDGWCGRGPVGPTAWTGAQPRMDGGARGTDGVDMARRMDSVDGGLWDRCLWDRWCGRGPMGQMAWMWPVGQTGAYGTDGVDGGLAQDGRCRWGPVGQTVWTGAQPVRWMVWMGTSGRRCRQGPGLLDGRCGRTLWMGACGADGVDRGL